MKRERAEGVKKGSIEGKEVQRKGARERRKEAKREKRNEGEEGRGRERGREEREARRERRNEGEEASCCGLWYNITACAVPDRLDLLWLRCCFSFFSASSSSISFSSCESPFASRYGFWDINSDASDFAANVCVFKRPPLLWSLWGVVLNSSVIGGKNLGVVLCFFGLVSRMFDVKKYVYNA